MIFTALIVTYNRLDKLKVCVTASLEAGFNRIVVVNNASTDDTQEWLNSLSISALHVIHLNENTGGAGGFRHGVEYIKDELACDWVVLFDDDAYPDKEIINKFKHHCLEDYSAYSCRVVDMKGNDCKMNKPFVKLPNNLKDNINYIFRPQNYITNSFKSSECVTLSFVGTIIKRDVLVSSINYIHHELFIYYDDVYFSHHLIQAGHKFKYEPELVFTHDVSIQGKSIKPVWKIYYLIRNLILCRSLFSQGHPFSYLSILLRLCKALALIPAQDNKRLYIYYFLSGLRDGWSGIMGCRHNGKG
ncbi:glycosyltransferase [Pantoea agglomerans]|uniref:glycosyltransferase n=1 Tax=Enterobacter agglomerans TaxID=549 RepID=UPI0017809F51|nr:glycosyltransferase [Pantoea agglomerans]WVL91126.1 glycosyltransferase [Pantoea agglomerans]